MIDVKVRSEGVSGRSVRGDGGLNQVASHPVAIGGCFAWLHEGASGLGGCTPDVAVLLCPALGWDGLRAYHGFRLLADQFASIGYPSLRLHYPGTGDSADLPDDPDVDRWQAWQSSIDQAADWLRETTGARHILLVGLRVGAMLAMRVAAGRADVAGLLLLAPVLRGKSYLLQLAMEARLEGADSQVGGGIERHELQLSAACVARLSALDLSRETVPHGLSIGLVPQAPSQSLDRCRQAWTAAGGSVQVLPFDGIEPLMQDAIHGDPPEPDFATLLSWANRVAPASFAPSSEPSLTPSPATPVVSFSDPMFDLGACVERSLRFGADRSLFGMLCQPAAGLGRRAVIIVNTGRDPHYGIARFGVELARQLAGEGIASLRMDFAGLGDSPAPPPFGNRLTSLFEIDRGGDVAAGIDALSALGCREFAVQGLCSGAYHALCAAERDKRVSALLLVNLPQFEWQGGDSVKTALWAAAPASRLVERLFDGAAWRRVLSGQADLRSFFQAQRRRASSTSRRWLPFLAPALPYPKRVMGTLADRGIRSLFLYSATDPGLDVLEPAFGRHGEGLRAYAGVDVQVTADIDHALSLRRMRQLAIKTILAFLVDDDRWSKRHDHTLDHSGSNDDGRPIAKPDARAAG